VKIGPNAITQLHTSLLHRLGDSATREIFNAARLGHYIDNPPEVMIDEYEVARLHRQVRVHFLDRRAREIMTCAGDRTGQYILANRIPRIVVFMLRHLPARWSARLLQKAIARHAWTFAGSGEFSIGREHTGGRALVASIHHNPAVALETADRPICDWHAAVFRRLYRELVSEKTTVVETRCCATGAVACRFRIEFPNR